MDERLGRRNLLGLAEFGKSDGTSGRVRCSKGVGAPSPPPELSVGVGKRDVVDGRAGRRLARLLRSSGNVGKIEA